MSFTYKILGQQCVGLTEVIVPGYGGENGTTEELLPVTLYTVPAGTQAVVSAIFATNSDVVGRTYDLAIVPAGESLAVRHHIRWDEPVEASSYGAVTAKIPMGAGDKIVVLPSSADSMCFSAFGIEIVA